MTSQTEQYVKRLAPNIRRALLQKLTPDQFTDLYQKKLAENADAVEKRMSLILGCTVVHADVPMRDILQSDKSHRSVLGSQKRPRERSSGKSSEVQTSPPKGTPGRSGKAPKCTGSSAATPQAGQLH